MLDSSALETSYSLLERIQPDYIEVLPGVMPDIIKEVMKKQEFLSWRGLIHSAKEVDQALSAGATAVTTSRK